MSLERRSTCVAYARQHHVAAGHAMHHGHSNGQGHGAVIGWARRYDVLLAVALAGRGRRLRAQLGDMLRLQPTSQVLDVGCGTGTLATALGRRVADGAVHGIDPSPQMIALATSKARKHNLPATFHVAAAQSLPFPDQSFDAAISTFALHHIPESDRLPAVTDILRVLRPGSPLVIADFQPPTNRLLRTLARHLLGPAMDHDEMPAALDLLTAAGAIHPTRGATVVGWLAVASATAP